MTSKGFSTLLNTVQKAWIPSLQSVRYRYWKDQQGKGPLIRRFGYDDNKLPQGLLAHVKSDRRIRGLPIFRPKDLYNDTRAHFGQNDYIDILGDFNLHPTKLHYHLPTWIRGAQGNEFQLLLRKRKALKHGIMPHIRPTKWKQMEARIEWLHKYLHKRQLIGFTTKYA